MTYIQSGTYSSGEVPSYSFCEGICAGSNSRWHIRKVRDSLHLTGGVNTDSLCGKVRPLGPEVGSCGGWDVNVKITDHHLTHCCPTCADLYRKEDR
jgi:hypothetical protein